MGTAPGHPRVPGPAPRLLALLLGLAGAAAAEPRQVSGVLGESVLLSLDLPDTGTVKEIEWSFRGGTGATITLAEVGPRRCERPDPRDRFGDRLEADDSALRIRELKWGDDGIYQARIKKQPAELEDQSFNLSLYEPLTEPEIQAQLLSLTARECNLTLRCQAPAGSAAKVTWQPQGPLCGDSQTLCLSLPVTALGSNYTCVAGNDIQERKVTVQAGPLCHPQGDRRYILICLGVVALAVGAAGIAWIWWKKRRKKAAGSGHGSARDGPDRAALAPRPSRDPSPGVLYSEIQRIPLESQEQLQDNPTTVYSVVRAGPGEL